MTLVQHSVFPPEPKATTATWWQPLELHMLIQRMEYLSCALWNLPHINLSSFVAFIYLFYFVVYLDCFQVLALMSSAAQEYTYPCLPNACAHFLRAYPQGVEQVICGIVHVLLPNGMWNCYPKLPNKLTPKTAVDESPFVPHSFNYCSN